MKKVITFLMCNFFVGVAAQTVTHEMTVECPSLADQNGKLNVKYTSHGDGVSFPVGWKNVSKNAKTLALTFLRKGKEGQQDTVHWVVFNIDPGKVDSVTQNMPRKEYLPNEVRQATNSAGTIGYNAPSRPGKYRLALYALDAILPHGGGIPAEKVITAIKEHAIDQAVIEISLD